jgi:hypothetical protein
MPEATADLDDFPEPWEHEVWFARERSDMQPEAKAFGVD